MSKMSIIRWKPDFRYQEDKFVKVAQALPIDESVSVTDKESYRITLASLRGELANGLGNINQSSYSLAAGVPYNPRSDFSYLNRKDLTIVDIDNYIKEFERNLKNSDEVTKQQIEEQLEALKAEREEFINKNKKDGSDEE